MLGVTPLEDRTVPAAIPLTGPNGGLWVKVDTLTVATRTHQTAATGVTSAIALEAGTTYLAVASGTARIANDSTGFTDAEFIRYNKNTGPQDGSSPGFAWNNHGVRLAGVDGGTTTGNLWGTYQSDHQYVREFVGQGTTVTGYYSDIPGYYGDNSGTLQVDLYAEVPLISVTSTDTAEGSATGGFTFTRTGDLSSPLTVTYSVGGTATPGSDYTPLTGSITFASGEDRVEVPVEAFGDNTVDDGETVTATITAGTGYALDTAATTATVIINDQALTVSVQQVNDGTEGGSDGLFRFTRAGDLTAPLTVAYTASGTATAGSDYATLSGTVTFGIGQDTADVAVTVIDDTDTEPTETVTITLATSDSYQFGNDADTLFVRDNDTTKYIWVSTGSHDWNDPANWSTGTVPTSNSDVYFDGYYSTVDCINVGDGLSTLGGLHLVNGYTGTATLAHALSVVDFEEASGTLNQPVSGRDLTVTSTMLWTGGTLNATDSGAVVNVSGAVGRLDPPDTGSMAIASTLRVVNNALVTFLPGTLDFTGGQGMYIGADVKVVSEKENVSYTSWKNVSQTPAQIEIAAGGRFALRTINKERTPGVITFELPILNQGQFVIRGGIRTTIKGHIGGNNGPSLKQTSGTLTIYSGGDTVANGISISGGDLDIVGRNSAPVVGIKGNLIFDADAIKFRGDFVRLNLDGNLTWTDGTYEPRIDSSSPSLNDRMFVYGAVRIDGATFLYPSILGSNEASGDRWLVIYVAAGASDFPLLPTSLKDDWSIVAPEHMGKWNGLFFSRN